MEAGHPGADTVMPVSPSGCSHDGQQPVAATAQNACCQTKPKGERRRECRVLSPPVPAPLSASPRLASHDHFASSLSPGKKYSVWVQRIGQRSTGLISDASPMHRHVKNSNLTDGFTGKQSKPSQPNPALPACHLLNVPECRLKSHFLEGLQLKKSLLLLSIAYKVPFSSSKLTKAA